MLIVTARPGAFFLGAACTGAPHPRERGSTEGPASPSQPSRVCKGSRGGAGASWIGRGAAGRRPG